ncbi:MAG: cupredoxin domain-containing protein [Actinomycetota bacterium]
MTDTPQPAVPDRRNTRRAWHLRTNAVVLLYVAAALAALLLYDALRVPRWLIVHLLMLGAITNAIVTWSEHFAVALLRAPAPSRRWSAVRLAALNIAVVAILIGVTVAVPALAVAGAVLLAAIVTAHGISLAVIARRALMGRFAGTVRFYLAAGVSLLVGITFGTLMVRGDFAASHAQLHAAHVHANVFGWVALSVLGTLFTLWPTVLRTRMVEGVMGAARQSLWLLGSGLAVSVAGFAADLRWLAAAGLAAYAGGVLLALKPFAQTWRQKAPRDAASAFLAAGTTWLAAAVIADIALLVRGPDIASYVDGLDALVPALVVGFALQTLVGALSYLAPVISGGGPAAMRASIARLERRYKPRVVALNLGVVIVAVDGLNDLPKPVTTIGWLLVSASIAAFLWQVVAAVLPDANRMPTAVVVVFGIVALGLPIVLTAQHRGERPVAVRAGQGQVPVSARNLAFSPRAIEVPTGTRVRLVMTNFDAVRHNLAFAGVPTPPLLAQGEHATVDLGVVTHNITGWCSVPGHRAAGMTFDIRVTAAP